MWESLPALLQLSPRRWGKVSLLSPPLLSLWPSNPTNAPFIPLLFLKVIQAHVASRVCGWVSLLPWALMPRVWRQWKHSSAGFAAASLPASGPRHPPGLSSSAHAANTLTAGSERSQAWVCLHIPRACFPPRSTARWGGRSYSELCFPASSSSSCCTELVRFYIWQ